jgi:hypothetical protein
VLLKHVLMVDKGASAAGGIGERDFVCTQEASIIDDDSPSTASPPRLSRTKRHQAKVVEKGRDVQNLLAASKTLRSWAATRCCNCMRHAGLDLGISR